MTVTIDDAGRIVVPEPVRQRLGLRPGTCLELLESPEGLTLTPTTDQPRLVRQGALLVYAGPLDAGQDLLNTVQDDRESRIRDIWSR